MWSIQFDQHNLYIIGQTGQTVTVLPNNKWGNETAGTMLEWRNDVWEACQDSLVKHRAA
jgi:hypothetical protein